MCVFVFCVFVMECVFFFLKKKKKRESVGSEKKRRERVPVEWTVDDGG